MQRPFDGSVLAVILNRNEFELTERCLASLAAQSTAVDILLIDNHSDEDPTGVLKAKFPDILSIRNSENEGVAGGRNAGVTLALRGGYQYVLFFDNDAVAHKGMVDALLNAGARHPEAGVLGPKILKDNASQLVWRAGCTSWKWTYLHAGPILLKRLSALLKSPLPLLLDTTRGENRPDRGQYDREEDVDFQIGCAQLIRTDVFRDVGILDEEFSPYGSEDIDFCARAQCAGWRIRYVPAAKCWHRVGGSFQDEYQRAYCNTRHILLLARKHLHPVYFCLLYLPDFFCLTLPLMLAESMLQRKKVRIRAILDAVRWHLADIKQRGLLLRTESAL